MKARIPVIYGELDVSHVWIGESVGLSSVYCREKRVVSHSQCREDRGSYGLLECTKRYC